MSIRMWILCAVLCVLAFAAGYANTPPAPQQPHVECLRAATQDGFLLVPPAHLPDLAPQYMRYICGAGLTVGELPRGPVRNSPPPDELN